MLASMYLNVCTSRNMIYMSQLTEGIGGYKSRILIKQNSASRVRGHVHLVDSVV